MKSTGRQLSFSVFTEKPPAAATVQAETAAEKVLYKQPYKIEDKGEGEQHENEPQHCKWQERKVTGAGA